MRSLLFFPQPWVPCSLMATSPSGCSLRFTASRFLCTQSPPLASHLPLLAVSCSLVTAVWWFRMQSWAIVTYGPLFTLEAFGLRRAHTPICQ